MSAVDSQEGWHNHLKESQEVSEKSWWTAFWLSLLFGYFGVDRFYLGNGVLGFFKVVSFGGGGILWLLDLVFLLMNRMKDGDGRLVKRPF